MKWMAPRARFELATLRLTAEQPIQSELAGVGANRRNSASCDETGRITFSFFIHLSFAFCHHSPLLLLRFYDGASYDKGRAFSISPTGNFRVAHQEVGQIT